MSFNLPLDVSLSLDEKSLNKVRSLLTKEALKAVYEKLKKSKIDILKHAKEITRKNLLDSPEIKSLMDENGKLRIEFGIEHSVNSINGIVDFIVNSIDLDIY